MAGASFSRLKRLFDYISETFTAGVIQSYQGQLGLGEAPLLPQEALLEDFTSCSILSIFSWHSKGGILREIKLKRQKLNQKKISQLAQDLRSQVIYKFLSVDCNGRCIAESSRHFSCSIS